MYDLIKKAGNIKFKTIFISLIISFFLWLYVKLGDTYVYQMDIPIVPINIQSDKVLKNEIPPYATIRLEGKGSSLMGLLLLWRSKVEFHLDLSTINFSWECNLNEYIKWVKLPGGYEKIVVDEIITPEVVSIELENLAKRKVRISSENIKVQTLEHYVQVGEIKFEPDSVVIFGPESRIIKIESIDTEFKEYKDKKRPIRGDYVNIKKVYESIFSYDINGTNVNIDIQVIGERTLEAVDVEVTNVPAGYRVRVEPGTINLIIRGGNNFIYEVNKEDIKAEIPWKKEWRRYREYREKLVVRHPKDIISYEELPKVFTVIIG